MTRSYSSAKGAYKKVTHVIFDMDGLLLDSERLYTEATQNIVSKYGKMYTWEIKSQLMGLTGVEAAKRIVELMELPITWEEYYEAAQEQYKLLMPNTNLMPDTEGIYKRVIEQIAASYGKKYTPQVRFKLLGRQEIDVSKIAVKEMELPIKWETFLEKFQTESKKRLTNSSFMPGAERFVRHLHSNSVPIAVATSSTKESFEIKIGKHKDFFKLFNHTVTGGSDPEVKQGKPSPDIFLVCASRFTDKPAPENCLVFEDAPNGITAANSAGMQNVMIPDKQLQPEQCSHATLVIPSMEVFKPELFGLPPFK